MAKWVYSASKTDREDPNKFTSTQFFLFPRALFLFFGITILETARLKTYGRQVKKLVQDAGKAQRNLIYSQQDGLSASRWKPTGAIGLE